MEKKFKTGDLVKLKSGGPKMTVDFYKNDKFKNEIEENEGVYYCKWFVSDEYGYNEELKEKQFHQDMLMKINE